jgi:hypothetical protein
VSRRAVTILASVVAAAVPGLITPAAASPPPTAHLTAAGAGLQTALPTAPPTPTKTTAMRVRLLSGDTVSVSRMPNGAPAVSVTAAPGAETALAVQVVTTPTATYAIPRAFLPVLGTQLDLSLFDVTKIAAAGPSGLPVTVTYTSTTSPTAVPGVEIRSRSGRTATGVITPASSVALAKALRTSTPTGLFGTVTKVTAAGGGVVQPAFPMHTLTVSGIDAAGEPLADGLVLVVNVDNMGKFFGVGFLHRGIAKVSVPAGRYMLLGTSADPTAANRFREVVMPTVSVTGSTTVTMDARSATAPLSFATPRPATTTDFGFSVGRKDATSTGSFTDTAFFSGRAQLWVSPTAPVRVGRLEYLAVAHLESPADAPSPYTYDVGYVGAMSIPSTLRFVARSADVATVTARYYSPEPAHSIAGRMLANASSGMGFGYAMPSPAIRTEYVVAGPGTRVQDEFTATLDLDTFEGFGYLHSGWWTAQPGTTRVVDWGRAPLTPRLFEGDGDYGRVCPACVVGDEIGVFAYPYSDSDPDHVGLPDWMTSTPRTTATWQVGLDGTEVATGEGMLGTVVSGASTAKRLTVDYQTGGRTAGARVPSTTRTHWDAPLKAATGAVPSTWWCWITGGNGSDPCKVLPLLSVRYLLPVDLANTIAPGPTTARIVVGHVNASVPVGVRTVTASVSFDAGATWQAATVRSEGAGNYSATFTTPQRTAATEPAWLKVAATDILGGHFTETVTAAFTVRR